MPVHPEAPPASPRRPIVGVMGSGREEHAERAEPLGEWVARQGFHLLTGGGAGVMAAVSRGFARVVGRQGCCLGIVPGGAGPAYPNPWVEIPILTHLPLSGRRGTDPLSRSHLNVLTSSVVVALPGGAGTRSEVELALRYHRAVVGFLSEREEIPGLPAGVALARDLAAVARFVLAAVGR